MKPWIAIQKYMARKPSTIKSRLISFVRFLLCFLVSICVLLQGVGTNTLGMPKQRWYPNYNPKKAAPPEGNLMLRTPMVTINTISWDDLWGTAGGMFGEDYLQTGQIVAAISASQTFLSLVNL